MRDIDEFLPQVSVFVRSIPEPVALRFIREAARDLCQRTKAWKERDEFELNTPDCEGLCSIEDASIEEIKWANLDGIDLEPKTTDWLDMNVPGWDGDDETGAARYITQLTPNTVTVVPKAPGLLKLRLVLIPSRTALTLPDFLLDRYATEIGKGAAGRCMLLPGQEYTNPQLGSAYAAEFTALLDTLSVRATKGQQRAPMRTKGAYF